MFDEMRAAATAFFGSDQLADFERDDARKEAWLRTRPICAACEEPIQEEYAYIISGEYYCERCVRDARTYLPEE